LAASSRPVDELMPCSKRNTALQHCSLPWGSYHPLSQFQLRRAFAFK